MTETEPERRKRLRKQYQALPRLMGVYMIRNRVSGRLLVGANRDLRARFNRHRMNLKFGTEENAALQADWLKYGAEAFSFDVAEQLEPLDEPGYDPSEDLATLKALWLEKLTESADQQFY